MLSSSRGEAMGVGRGRGGRTAALLVVAGAAVAAVVLIGRRAPPPPGGMEASAPVTLERMDGVESDLAALERRIEDLRREQQQLARERRAASTERSDGETTPAKQSSSQPSNDPPAPEPADRASEEARLDELVIALDRQHGRQRRDPGWSAQAEADLARAVGGGLLAGSKLDAAACQTTLCRAEVTHADADAQERFFAALIETLPPGSQSFMRKVEGEGDAPRTLFYVARPGHPLPAD